MLTLIFFLFAAFGLGSLTTRLLPLRPYRPERLAIATFLGLFLSAWLLLIAAWLGSLAVAGPFVIVLGLAAGTATRFMPVATPVAFPTIRQRSLWFWLTASFSLIVSYLLYTHMLGPVTGGYGSASGSWGDLPLHLSIMSNVAAAPRFDWDFSLLAGSKLTYPFLVDFLSGMVAHWTGSLRVGLLAVSLPLCLSLIQILFFACVRLLKGFRAGAIAATLFLLSGSSFGFALMLSDFFRQRPFALSFLWNLPRDYSNTDVFGYGNFFNSILLPQRSFQFGLAAFCLVAVLLSGALEAGTKNRRHWLLPAALLVGLLPLAHTHTFFVSAGFLGLAVAYLLWKKRLSWCEALLLAFITAALAVPQLAFQLTANGHLSFLKQHAGWMFSDGTFSAIRNRPLALAAYLAANFGLLFLAAATTYRKLTSGPLRVAFWCGVAIFIAGNIFIFQPAEYDNIKFFLYGSLLLIPAIASWVAEASRSENRPRRFAAFGLTTILVASGTAAVSYELPQHTLLYTHADLQHARALRQALPAGARVLTSDYHQHPLWGLAGQPVVRGYEYWLRSYGLPVTGLGDDIRRMYAGGDEALVLMKKYGVSFVYVGESETTMYEVNEAYFAERFPLSFSEPWARVYSLPK